ncbi:MAG: 5'/3'-nucleotidase SurE [Chitinispirillia bacterium]|jgi:5'-nucleotidase
MDKKQKILLTNDDGFFASGINHLYNVLKKKYIVTVVAPENEQSGVGHAFTYKKPLIVKKRFINDGNFGYSVSGTPSDCIKIAVANILTEKPDLVVSGINNGNNTGIAAFYSGTVAAAREGAFWHIPGIAISLYENSTNLFKEYSHVSERLINIFINNLIYGNPKIFKDRIFLNVNYPACHPDLSKGIRITKQSLAFYIDNYTPKKLDDFTFEYWLNSENSEIGEIEPSNDYDTRAIRNNFITITPLHIDSSEEQSIKLLTRFKKLKLTA